MHHCFAFSTCWKQDNFKYIIYDWICTSTIAMFINIDTDTTLLLTSIHTNNERHRHHLLPPFLNEYSNELFKLLFVFIHTGTRTNRHHLFKKKKKVVDVNRNGLVKLLFVSIYKKTLFVVVILTLTYKHC